MQSEGRLRSLFKTRRVWDQVEYTCDLEGPARDFNAGLGFLHAPRPPKSDGSLGQPRRPKRRDALGEWKVNRPRRALWHNRTLEVQDVPASHRDSERVSTQCALLTAAMAGRGWTAGPLSQQTTHDRFRRAGRRRRRPNWAPGGQCGDGG